MSSESTSMGPEGEVSLRMESTLRELAGPLLGWSDFPVNKAGDSERGSPKSEAHLRMDEARYRTLVELLPAITFLAVFEGGLQESYVSPQIESVLGYSQAEWLSNPVLWYERLHPDDKEKWNLEFAQTVASGQPFRAAYRFLARDGRVVWLHGEVRIARDANGQPRFLHGIGIDITKIKEAEQQVREYSELLQRKNRELEQFAYVASHDLQEPLRTVVSYSQILTEDYGDQLDAQARQYFDRIANAARRMKNLIQSILEFSRIGHGEARFEIVDFEQIFQEALANLQGSIQESGAVVTRDSLPRLKGVRTNMLVLFQNLISNAIKYRSSQPPRIHISAVKQKDNSWLFTVRDNGIGIDQKYWEKVFVIFQRLHGQHEHPGTGIGLSVCKKIVEHQGGRIWVESEAGRGAEFKIQLPANPMEVTP